VTEQMCFLFRRIYLLYDFSCNVVLWIEERRFWTFEGVISVFGVVSAISVFIRQKQLDHKMYKRIQKQITSGV
jgi:hypothetical protein